MFSLIEVMEKSDLKKCRFLFAFFRGTENSNLWDRISAFVEKYPILQLYITYIGFIQKPKKNPTNVEFVGFLKNETMCRSDPIRTGDLCVPNAALYQTEPRFDLYINERTLANTFRVCHRLSKPCCDFQQQQ